MRNISITIQDTGLSLDQAYQFVLNDSCGGNCLFVGTIRDLNMEKEVEHIDFDSYDAMAIKEMNLIAEEALVKYNIQKVLIHHRKGDVRIQDIAVIIAISAVHRDACFGACQYAIDQLKSRVPIWKKEFYKGGTHWINARP